jgi:hypothetical protein
MTLDERLQQFVRTWEPSLAREFLQYDRLLRKNSPRPPSAWGRKAPEPYWKELPRWLAGQQRNGAGEVSPEFLDTVLWGQTSLFYAVRLQDDLLDGEYSRSPLALAPLLFMTEADRAFSSIIDSNAGFWRQYRLALETTVAGIVRVAAMQRDPAAHADELLQVYGCVDAIFSVGASAVCERMGTADTIPRIKEFVSELGKVLLTLDDVEDIEEDLADGRLNYPARILLGRGIPVETDHALLAKIRHLDARAGGFDEVMRTLLGCLGRAADAINPLELQAAMDLIETTKAAVLNIRDAA